MFTGQTVVFNYFEKKRANMVSGKVISLFCMYPGFPDARAPRNSRKGSGRSISRVLLLLVLGFSCGPLGAQVINEVITQNSTQDPADVACGLSVTTGSIPPVVSLDTVVKLSHSNLPVLIHRQ